MPLELDSVLPKTHPAWSKNDIQALYRTTNYTLQDVRAEKRQQESHINTEQSGAQFKKDKMWKCF